MHTAVSLAEPETEPERPAARDRVRDRTPSFAYQPALDGLRALAVLGVLLYHAGVSWAPGGFLGVDAFFVLSGFLITSLLVDEWRTRGRIDFGAFWARRARRLLPALLLVVIALFARNGILGIIEAAARRWHVEAARLVTDQGRVRDPTTGRMLDYAALVDAAADAARRCGER